MSDLTQQDQANQPATDAVSASLPGAGLEIPVIPVVARDMADMDELVPPMGSLPLTPPQPTVPLTDAVAESHEASPLLRLWRLLGGIGALATAWGFTVVILVLYNAAWGFVSGQQVLLARVGVALASAVVALWLAVAMIACLMAGAYCLALGLTRRSW